MKKIIIVVLLAFTVSTAVFAQPAPRPFYLAEVEFRNRVRSTGNLHTDLMNNRRRTFRVWAYDEADAERRVRGGRANVDARFIRWIPQSEITAEDRAALSSGQAIVQRNSSSSTPAPARQLTATDFINRGNEHLDNDRLNEAIADFNQAIRLEPNNSLAYSLRGDVYYFRNNLDQAIADYNQAIRLDPNNAEAYSGRGAIHINRGNVNEAMADLNNAIRLDPNNEFAYIRRSALHFINNNFDQAIADASQAIRLNPNNDAGYTNRGLAYLEKNDWNRAVADFNQMIRLDPNYKNAYFYRAYAQMKRNNLTQARTDVNRALQLDPNYLEAQMLSDELLRLGY